MDKNKRKKAFTLVEVIVVLGMISLLSAVLIPYNRVGKHQITLFKEQAKIINAISRAKSLSITFFNETGTDFACGYGVSFNASAGAFLIFKDLPSISLDCSSADNIYSGSNEIFESFSLDPAVEFSNLTSFDIVFIPPDPSVIITPDSVLSQGSVIIVVKIIDGGSSAMIKLNSAGQIST